VALFALYGREGQGGWARIWVASAAFALYLNVFVLVAQLFAKVPALRELAPTQSEPPFAVAQLVVMAAFLWLGVTAVRRARGAAARPTV